MKRRIYWLLPDLASTGPVMRDLLCAGIDARHMHFAARDGLDLTGLHAANVLQTSDVVHAARSGLLIGGALGICVGLAAALFFPVMGDALRWELASVLAVMGGAMGAWSASMVGISIASPQLSGFEEALAGGQVLLMVDVAHAQVPAVTALLQAAHPQSQLGRGVQHTPVLP